MTSVSPVGNAGTQLRRTILHVDMDMFFVAVELRRNPDLIGKPVVVGSSGPRGVVAAASYEARRFGVFSAMSSAQAKRLCRDAIFLPNDTEHYAEASNEVFQVFHSFTPLVEGLSLDEAFLDVTGALRLFGDGMTIGHEIRRQIADQTNLTCSVGVAPNKFLAKLASVSAKPLATKDGVTSGLGVFEVRQGRELEFLYPLAVEALWGVGPVTLEKLLNLGIKTVEDLANFDLKVLVGVLGSALGFHLSTLARGADDRPVEPNGGNKSIGHEETFAKDVTDYQVAHDHLVRLADAVADRCRNSGLAPRTVSLKIKYANFQLITRSVSLDLPMTSAQAMVRLLEPHLRELDFVAGIRLLGVSAKSFDAPNSQLSLFEASSGSVSASDLDAQWTTTTTAIDEIRHRFGDAAIKPASTLSPKPHPTNDN